MPDNKMLKRLILFLLLSVTALETHAQQRFGNEWINHSQTYYKIKVVQTGLYRLNHAYLSSIGLSSVNPQHFQLFRRGKEIPLYVAGEADGRLDAQDFVEFYGERNDGVLDSELYKDPSHQVHKFASYYTDTAAYFLTINPSGGKRMREVNPTANGKSPEPYHLQKSFYWGFQDYYEGRRSDGYTRMPWMDKGEGRVTNTSRFEKSYTLGGIVNVEATGPKPQVYYSAFARNYIDHNFAIRIVDANNAVREIARHRIYGDGHLYAKYVAEFSDITPQGNFTLRSLADRLPPFPNGAEDTRNQISVPFAILTFPQKSIFQGNSMYFYTDSSRTVSPYFEFSNAPASAVAYDITDINNVFRIAGHEVNGKRGYVVDGTDGKSHKVFLANTNTVLTPLPAQRVSFRKIDPAAHNFILLTNKRLMAPASGASMPAPKEYAAYRASPAGGGYDTLLVFVDDLVEQFHYGEFSSFAIKNFLHFMSSTPRNKHLLILGKGIDLMRMNYRSTAARSIDLVPTGGSPASDIIFSADFHNNDFVPKIPTGRVSATSPDDIINYLNKVKQYEAAPEGVEWRKNILQLGGGKTLQEINSISYWLKEYKEIAKGPLLGANVIEKYRQNVSEVVETISIAEELNKGLSLITFFGHSSPGTTDLDIGFVSGQGTNYKNEGKYPVMLMNGCNVGDAFISGTITFGEDWLNTPNKGAVGLIAHTDAGFPDLLNLYSKAFYTKAFQDPALYGSSIGKIQQEVIRNVMLITSGTGNYDGALAMVTEMALQGDPSLKLYSPSKPDYYFKNKSFEVKGTDGEPVTASSENFTVSVNVGNLGKAINDSVYVTVKRTLADNSTVVTTAPFKVEPIINDRIVKLTLSNKGLAAVGMNSFEIKLDGTDAVEELDETNNIAIYQHFFPVSGLKALSPADYAVVKSNEVKLQVQATHALLNKDGYYFELDTTQAFNSSLKKSHSVGNALLPSWQVSLPKGAVDTDSTVYYWRVRFQTYQPGEDTVWTTSSFRYMPATNGGWSQSHYGQFTEASTDKIKNEGDRNVKWEFQKTKVEISVKTVGGDTRYTNPPHGIFYNGQMLFEAACGNPGGSATPRIFAIVVNDKTLEMVEKLGASFCASFPYLYEFGDLNQAANREKIVAFMNTVPEGYHVVAMSVNRVPFESFTAAQKAAFGLIGSNLIHNLKNGYPFAIVGRKGATPGTVNERTGEDGGSTTITSQLLILDDIIYSRQPKGTVTSTLIGPSMQWKTLHHNIERYKAGNDTYTLKVIGIDKAGQEQTIVESVNGKVHDLSAVDAKRFPYLRLSATLNDEQDRTAPQLKQWFVLYEEAPEGIIMPDLAKVGGEVLTQQAQKGGIKVPMAFQNITSNAFRDSVTVEVTVRGDNSEPVISSFKIKPVGANETVNFEFSMPTSSMEGDFRLSMYVNPRILPEQNYANNIYEVSFHVNPKLHPIMDVAFDGIHILDGELVSPSPLISVTLKDENKFAPLQDPSSMLMTLTDPNEVVREISLMNNAAEVRYFPADEKNDFRLEFKPERLENGVYKLEVRAKDSAGRASGVTPYNIRFEVENASKITNFYPFPNPFSTKTNFIFTLTGAEVPENMKIQILTVTGKVVKEIMKEEIGPIRIGNNKTEYAWDGTDMYGDKLANGVYLYRVVMSQVADGMKHMYKIGDKSFKNGYGKIYILR
ncbi:C25 family cysteine peptidase [Pontibacter locisalis]|uniref:C25 family cysteine peptidase n=1 Tax=Pontibacter locisalis TaxID=1719035 RepID=A0ABW5IJF9_9BACT